MIQVSEDLLQRIQDELGSLMDMMEPYYSQNGGEKDAVALIEEIALLLPYEEVIPGASRLACPICGKRFTTAQGVSCHLLDVHQVPSPQRAKIRKALEEQLKEKRVIWPTKAAYLTSLHGNSA